MGYDRLSLELRQRAAYWRQRAKFRALKEGDSNTAFFHAHATGRMRRNHIRSIAVNGVQVTSHSAKVNALTQYFRSILGTPGQNQWNFDCQVLYHDLPKANDNLTTPFNKTEAIQAVKSMNRSSVPGPDGFGPGFYKAAWQTVKPDIMLFLSASMKEMCSCRELTDLIWY